MELLMRAGTLKRRVTIQAVTEGTQDGYGEPAEVVTTFATRWASVEPLSGAELYRAHEMHPEVTHSVRLRYLDGVTAKMRVLFGTRSFEIKTVLNTEETNRELVLLCTELL
jgi:SPP1 family predicted phage head-tail adaptor